MVYETLNKLFSLIMLCLCIRILFFTFKEPSESFLTNLRLFVIGLFISIISTKSLLGEFNLFQTMIDLLKSSLRIRTSEDETKFAFFILTIMITVGFIFFHPIKVLKKYRRLENKNVVAKSKILIDSSLFYFTILFLVSYLITRF